jgi:NitT/TauT family transport system permease protein
MHDPVQFRGRRYSPDERRNVFQVYRPALDCPEANCFEVFLLKVSDPKDSTKIHGWAEKMSKRSEWTILLSLVFALAVWSAIVHWSDLPAFVLPSPAAVWNKFVLTLKDGSLLFNTWVTLKEVLAGLLAGSCLAILLGYFLARSATLEKLISPLLVAGQAVPTVAIAPILIIWFGSGISSKVLICALTVFFPILVNTIIGFRSVPAPLHNLMQSMHASRWQVFKLLEVPASLPVLLGGLRIGATLSVIGAVVGEFVGSDQGLGFLINLGRGQYDMALVFVAIFTLMVLALALYGSVVITEHLSMPWRRNH